MEEQKLLKKKRQAKQDNNWRLVAETSNKLGALYNETGAFEEAREQFEDEFNAYKKLGAIMDAARAERMIGEMLMLIGEHEKALKHEQNYLKVALDEQDKVEQQRAYATIGRIHLVHAQSEETPQEQQKPLSLAEKAFLEAVLLCKSLDKQVGRYQAADMEARIYLNLGVCKEISEEYQAASDYMQTAIQIAKKYELHDLLHQCYISAALMHSLKIGDTSKALYMFNVALQVAERLSDKTSKLCETLQAKGEVQLKTGDATSAKQSLKRAWKLKCSNTNLRESIESTLKVIIALERAQEKLLKSDSQEYSQQKQYYETLGDGWCKLGNYSKAIEYYLKMLECAELDGGYGKDLVPIYVSLYQTYRDNKQYDLALVYMQKEHDLVKDDPQEAFVTLMNIAEVQEVAGKGFFDVENSYRQARDQTKMSGDRTGERRVLSKWLKLCRKFDMVMNEEELVESMKVDDINPEIVMTESEIDSQGSPLANDTPDIGDDICLDDFLSSDEDDTPSKDISRGLRKRPQMALAVKKNAKGETGLHQACISGNLRLVKQLLEQGHPTMVRDNAGWLPIHEACNHGFKEIVEEILSRDGGKGLNDKGGPACEGITPLYDACCNGNLEIIELLLERGADPTIKTDAGDSALDALKLWRESANLDPAEETLYLSLKQKLQHSLEKTGHLKTSTEKKLRKSETDPVASSSRSTASSRSSGQRIRDIRHGLDLSDSESDSGISYTSKHTVTPKIKPKQTPPLRHTPDEFRARSDYKEVMERLRNPHPTSSLPNVIETQVKRRPALLQVNDVNHDTWLDDDIGPRAKKQKFMPTTLTRKSSFTKKSSFNPKPSPIKSSGTGSQEPSSTVEWDNFGGLFDFEEPPLWQQSPHTLSSGRDKSSPKKVVRKVQSSLIDAGFSRSESPILVDSIPDSTVDEIQLPSSIGKPQRTLPLDRGQVFKSIAVKIEDEIISVPVKSDEIDRLDIDWLVKEVIRRYSNLFGRQPEIRLTIDGALVETSDPLALIFTAVEIRARILRFNTVSITERYKAACNEHKQESIQEVIQGLEMCQSCNQLKLDDFGLSTANILPISVALRQEITLVSINLANNWIQDDGIKHFSECLNELRMLQELDLTGNCIGPLGIMQFLKNGQTKCIGLRKLVMSHNPIESDGANMLFKNGLNCFPEVKELHLCGCEIEKLDEPYTFLGQIQHLNISHNDLTQSSRSFLGKSIDHDRIEVLDLTNTVSHKDNKSFDWSPIFLRDLPNLNELYMASNLLMDGDIWQIINSCSKLKILDLSHNLQLTSNVFDYLISLSSTTKNCSVQKLYLNGCQKVIPFPLPNHNQIDEKNEINSNYDNHYNFPEYMELTLHLTDNRIRLAQENYIRRLCSDWCKKKRTSMGDLDDEGYRNHMVAHIKVNKYHLIAQMVDAANEMDTTLKIFTM